MGNAVVSFIFPGRGWDHAQATFALLIADDLDGRVSVDLEVVTAHFHAG